MSWMCRLSVGSAEDASVRVVAVEPSRMSPVLTIPGRKRLRKHLPGAPPVSARWASHRTGRFTMDAALLDQLETEHRQVEELFSKLETADSESEQRPLVEELVAALTRHMEIEEAEVYPEVANVDAEMAGE